jgi:nifR3 family TIM-barrel protein
MGFWEKLKKPIMSMAPMSGISDEAFRLMFLKYGRPDVFWTEFVSVDGLVSEKGRDYCLNVLKHDKREKPIVAQIFGSNPLHFEKSAKIIADLGFDGVDINMGCPDRDIEKNGGGAVLIKNPELAKEIIRATKKGAPSLPVSVKTRIGYDKNEIKKWIPLLLEENISALTVHFRTRKELLAPLTHWELAKEIVKLRDKISPKTLIFGNGDVKSLKQAKKLVEKTGLDGIMIGRGLLGNVWFFSEKTPTISQRLNAIIEHAEILENFHKKDIDKNGCYKQFDGIKKHFHAYTKGFRGAKELREKLMKTKNTSQAVEICKRAIENDKIKNDDK